MAQKRGLGKGLGALIPNNLTTSTITPDTHVSISMIEPNPNQPRSEMAEGSLDELAASIKEHGILQPLIVTYDPISGMYTLIAGERRLRAAKIAGLEKVPVVIRSATQQERLELALIENVQRDDLSPLEIAHAYQQLADEFNLSHDEISTQVGKSRVTITNTLRLLKLPETIQQALREERITEGHARTLLSLTTPQSQLNALHTILVNELNVRQAEDLVRRLNGIKPVSPVIKSVDPDVEALQDKLSEKLGTKVILRLSGKGGSLTIYYYSDEELNSISRRLLKD